MARAQGITTGGISGTVVDASGSVIPFATITIVNSATGAKYEQSVRPDGDFSVLNLPLGSYTLTINATGFGELKIESVNVTVGVLAIGKETLTVGGASNTIEASAVAPLLSTEQSQLGVQLDSEAIMNLPFNGGFDTVALLQPGVSITHDNSFSNSNGSYGGFSSQGQRGRANNFEIDGQSNNDNSVAGPQVFFSNQDALSGVEVITNNFSAQYGRNAGSIVNYLTKQGTNQFHGSAFEFYEGNWAESFAQGQKSPFLGYCAPGAPTANCVIPTLPRYVDNKFGGTIGGPIPFFKDKVWFFASALFERYRNGGGTALSGPNALTPTPNGLTQLQAAFPNDPGVAALVNNGPYSIKTGNPRIVGSPVILPVTIGTNAPVNIEFSEIGRSVPSLFNDEELLGRMDFAPTGKDHFFIRYFYQDDPYLNAGGGVVAGNWYNVPDTAHSIGADWSHTLTPAFVNQLRYSFQQTKLDFQAGAQPNCTVNTPDQCTTNIGITGKIVNSASYGSLSFGYATNIPQGRTVKVTQVQDNVTWSHGKQTILFGGEWDYQNSPNPFLPDYNGGFGFGGTADGTTGFGNFLRGVGSLNLGNGNSFSTAFTEDDAALYFQDDYKVTPDLTLNLGLRWEYDTQAANILHAETVKRESNAATAFWDQSLPIANRTVAASPNNWKEFQPRIGFAFNPSFDKKLVVRGGFSINFDPAYYNIFLNIATAAPVVNLGSVPGCGVTQQCLPSGGASGGQVRALDLPYIPVGPGINPGTRNQTIISPNFHNPYTESFLFGLSHQLGNHAVLEVDYVGNHQVGNFMSINANPNLTAVQAAFPAAAPVTLCADPTQVGVGHVDCTRRNVRSRNNGAFGIYNALETKITTQGYHGLSSVTSFTYSKTIDNVSEIFSTFAGGNTVAFAENPLNPNQGERGVSGNSEKFNASSGFNFQFPKFHSGNGFFGRVLSGYRVDTIWTFNTGQPLSPVQYGYAGAGPALQTYSDPGFLNWQLSGYDNARPIVSNPKAPITTVGIYDDGTYCGAGTGYFNLANCTPTTPTAVHWLRNSQLLENAANNPYLGVGRNTLRTQYWNNFDVALQKETKLNERVLMVISLNAYNAMNRQFLGTPDTFIDDAGGSFEDFRYNYGSNRNAQLKVDFNF
jgi:outer membrane receptor protein involved in Fe transport